MRRGDRGHHQIKTFSKQHLLLSLNTVTGDFMVSTSTIQHNQDYCCQKSINLYKHADCLSLVTQAGVGRHLRFPNSRLALDGRAVPVLLCEDDYPGWLAVADLDWVTPAPFSYCPPVWTATAIQAQIPEVIHFAYDAMAHPNTYLWGGTISPDYDCSGLIQAAFASVGIVIPRDSYQQEAFVHPVEIHQIQPGDLIFFGPENRTTHVALYVENGRYIHSSGKDSGRNGIGIDSITDLTDPVSQAYYQQLRSIGRITHSYQATGTAIGCR